MASTLYLWLTGQPAFSTTSTLPIAVNAVFDSALAGVGFASAADFATALETALEVKATAITLMHQSGRLTNVGMVRALNEDSMMALEFLRTSQSVFYPTSVYVVADGMGGHAAGEIASGSIVNTMAEKAALELVTAPASLDRGEWLKSTMQAANKAVFDLRHTAGSDMGSTMVAAVVEGSRAYIGHVGDSRAYIIHENSINRITIDHSLVKRLIATNQITRQNRRATIPSET